MADLIIYIALFVFGYAVGHAHMIVKLAHMIVEQDTELKQPGNRAAVKLDLEKHNDVYYAYLGGTFVGQADQLEVLFNNLVKNLAKDSKVSEMVIGESVTKLSTQDQAELSKLVSRYLNV